MSTLRFQQIVKFLVIVLLSSPLYWQIPVAAQRQQQLLPFFDDLDNPVRVGFPRGQQVDITPRPPKLNSFDQAVLQTCGSLGTSVSPNQFKQLLATYPDVLQKLQQVSGGELFPDRKNQSQFLEDLTNIWFKRGGFEHIFCGEIYNANDIGGLHFYGRYLQLQNQGIAGRLANNQQREEVVPGVIYTMGVVIKQGNRTVTEGLLTLSGNNIMLEPGIFVFMPANAPHALKAEENLAFLLTLSEKAGSIN